jgi:hypothetical protein
MQLFKITDFSDPEKQAAIQQFATKKYGREIDPARIGVIARNAKDLEVIDLDEYESGMGMAKTVASQAVSGIPATVAAGLAFPVGMAGGALVGAPGGLVAGGTGLVAGTALAGAAGYGAEELTQRGLKAVAPSAAREIENQRLINPKLSTLGQMLSGFGLARNAPTAIRRVVAERLGKNIEDVTKGDLLKLVGAEVGVNVAAEGGTQLAVEGQLDPERLAASGAAGLVQMKPTSVGKALNTAGERLAGRFVPSRGVPSDGEVVETTPTVDPRQARLEAAQQVLNAGDMDQATARGFYTRLLGPISDTTEVDPDSLRRVAENLVTKSKLADPGERSAIAGRAYDLLAASGDEAQVPKYPFIAALVKAQKSGAALTKEQFMRAAAAPDVQSGIQRELELGLEGNTARAARQNELQTQVSEQVAGEKATAAKLAADEKARLRDMARLAREEKLAERAEARKRAEVDKAWAERNKQLGARDEQFNEMVAAREAENAALAQQLDAEIADFDSYIKGRDNAKVEAALAERARVNEEAGLADQLAAQLGDVQTRRTNAQAIFDGMRVGGDDDKPILPSDPYSKKLATAVREGTIKDAAELEAVATMGVDPKTLEAELNKLRIIRLQERARGEGVRELIEQGGAGAAAKPNFVAGPTARPALDPAMLEQAARKLGLGSQPAQPGKSATPGTKANPPVPDNAAQVIDQIGLVASPSSTKAAAVISPGSPLPRMIPDGLAAMETPHGVVIYKPQKISKEAVVKATSGEQVDGRILGLGSDGSNPTPGGLAVTTSHAGTKDVLAEVVRTPEEARVASAAQQKAVPGGTVEVKPVGDVEAARLAMEAEVQQAFNESAARQAERQRAAGQRAAGQSAMPAAPAAPAKPVTAIPAAPKQAKPKQSKVPKASKQQPAQPADPTQPIDPSPAQIIDLASDTSTTTHLFVKDTPLPLPLPEHVKSISVKGGKLLVNSDKVDPMRIVRMQAEAQSLAGGANKPAEAQAEQPTQTAVKPRLIGRFPEPQPAKYTELKQQYPAPNFRIVTEDGYTYIYDLRPPTMNSILAPNPRGAFELVDRLVSPVYRNITRSIADGLRALSDPRGARTAQAHDAAQVYAATKYAADHEDYTAAFKGLSPQDKATMQQYLIDMKYDGFSAIRLPSHLANRVGLIRQALTRQFYDRYYAGGPYVGGVRMPDMDVNYVPEVTSRAAISIIQAGDGPDYQRLRNDFIAHKVQMGMSFDDATNQWSNMVKAFKQGSAMVEPTYNAVREIEGSGLPASMRAPLEESLFRHSALTHKDVAWFKHFQQDPEVAQFLGLTEDGIGGEIPLNDPSPSPVAKAFIANATSWRNYNKTWMDTVARLASAGKLGTVTGLRDFFMTAPNLASYLELRDLPAMASAYKRLFTHTTRDAIRAGAINPDRVQGQDIDSATDYGSATIQIAERVADVLRKYQGRELFEAKGRQLAFEAGRFVAMDRLQAGGAEKWLDKVLGDMNWRALGRNELLDAVGRKFVEKSQGNYGMSGLPAWMLEGTASPFAKLFFRMARFQVERFNNWYKDAWTPAVRGEGYGPLLKSVAGGLIGAGALNEFLNMLGVQPNSMTPRELAKAKDIDLKELAYTMFSYLDTAGTLGLLGSVGYSLNQVINNELPRTAMVNLGLDSMVTGGQRLMQFGSAVSEGGGLELLLPLVKTIATDNIQLMREIDKQFKDPNGKREERIFKRQTGQNEMRTAMFLDDPFDPVNALRDADSVAAAQAALPGVARKMETTGTAPVLRTPLRSLEVNPLKPDRPNFYQWMERQYGTERAAQQGAKDIAGDQLTDVKRGMIDDAKDQIIERGANLRRLRERQRALEP